jgi:hypothetical protein
MSVFVVGSAIALAPWAAQASLSAPAAPKLTNKPVPGIQVLVSCLSTHLCVLGGNSEKGIGDIVAVRNGVPASLQTVRHTQSMYSVSCPSASGCVALARPAKLRTIANDSLYGVSCSAKSRCYAAGFTQTGGLVLTLNGASPSKPQHVKADLFAIACSGTACTAAGEQLGGTAFVGVLVSVAAGHISSSKVVAQSGGYTGVARVRSVFTAIGSAQHAGSEVTTG